MNFLGQPSVGETEVYGEFGLSGKGVVCCSYTKHFLFLFLFFCSLFFSLFSNFCFLFCFVFFFVLFSFLFCFVFFSRGITTSHIRQEGPISFLKRFIPSHSTLFLRMEQYIMVPLSFFFFQYCFFPFLNFFLSFNILYDSFQRG